MKLQLLSPQFNETDEVMRPMLESIGTQQGVDLKNDIEVLIGNDGSDIKLSEEFLGSFSYSIRYEQFDHIGLPGTRSRLFDLATADYVMFCDADDMFLTNIALYTIFAFIDRGFDALVVDFMEEVLNRKTGRSMFFLHKRDSTFVVEPYFLPSFMQTETADYFNRNNKRYWHFCFPEEQIMPIPVFISLNVMYDLNVKSIRKGKDSRTHKSLTAHPGTPTMHMLQDSLLHFKNYVKKYPGKDILSMTLEDCMEIIMDHSLSENTGRFHTYLTESGKKKCRSRSLAVSGGYSRTLITFENGERKEERVDISVYRCRTCGHYHAVLPYHVIIPYVSYSVQFILSLFIDRKVRKMTVSALLRKYGLSRTTYYRLLKKLAPYYVIHRMTRDSYGMSLFVQAQADGRRLLDSVFTASCMALMEGSRTLHKQRPTSGTSPSLPE